MLVAAKRHLSSTIPCYLKREDLNYPAMRLSYRRDLNASRKHACRRVTQSMAQARRGGKNMHLDDSLAAQAPCQSVYKNKSMRVWNVWTARLRATYICERPR